MGLTRCARDHLYDAEKYSSCPYCSGEMGGENNIRGEQTTEAIISSFYPENKGSTDQKVTRATAFFSNVPDENGQTVGMLASGSGAAAPWMMPNNTGDETYSVNQPRRGVPKPVVGWLVCIEGSCYGLSFNLYAGKNFIGRSDDMDVSLTGDKAVSRVKHAIIIYEPRKRQFFAQPGESHELFYVNESVVLQNTLLKDRDVITIGASSLVFVPFCDDRHGWER